MPTCLAQWFPVVCDVCWRCSGNRASLIHVGWDCEQLIAFRRMIRTETSTFTDYLLLFHPKAVLLHDFVNCVDLQKHRLLIVNALAAAKILLAFYSKTD